MEIPSIFTSELRIQDWPARRAEILSLFSEHVYGCTPKVCLDMTQCKQLARFSLVHDVVCESYMLYFSKGTQLCTLRFSVYLPQSVKNPLPCVLMINPFDRNPSVLQCAARTYAQLPYEMLLQAGYAAVYVHVDDLCKDNALCFEEGLLQIAPRMGESGWGAIGVWAWAASRVIDWLCAQPVFDSTKIAVAGCSRAGKTALWCAAQDTRVALVISNVSGCTGAALTRGKQGEHIQDITQQFPHWMCEKYASYANREDSLPIDQHMLLALCAPRPLYVSSATEDDWADPHKEFEACVLAGKAYRTLGGQGLASERFPCADTPIYGGDIAYHIRTGPHGCQLEDWEFYLPFINKYFQ